MGHGAGSRGSDVRPARCLYKGVRLSTALARHRVWLAEIDGGAGECVTAIVRSASRAHEVKHQKARRRIARGGGRAEVGRREANNHCPSRA